MQLLKSIGNVQPVFQNTLEKFKSKKGESLIESLVALLICVLSMGILFVMIDSSTRLTRKADEMQRRYESTIMNVASQQMPDGSGTLTVATADGYSYSVPIEYYKSDGIGGVGVFSYHPTETVDPLLP